MDQSNQNGLFQTEPTQVKSSHTVWTIVITAIVVALLTGTGVYILQIQKIKGLEKQLNQTNQTLKMPASKSVSVKNDNAATINNSNINTVTTTKTINNTSVDFGQTSQSVNSQDIKNAFSKKYPNINFSSYTVKIDKYTDTYARGSISSGAGWFAKKINGIWTIVADGQAINCSDLDSYGFPKDFKSVYCG